MAAAEHQRAGAVERIDLGERLAGKSGCQQRQGAEQREERRKRAGRGAVADAGSLRRLHRRPIARQRQVADRGAVADGAELTRGGRHEQDERGRRNRKACADAAGSHAGRHAPYGLRHHRDRRDLKPVQPAGARKRAEPRYPEREQHHRDCRRHGEADPCGERACKARAHQPDADPDFAAGGARQELAERHEVEIGALVEPAPALNQILAKIAEMSDRAAERRETQPQECGKHFERCAPMGRRRLRVHVLGHFGIGLGDLQAQWRAAPNYDNGTFRGIAAAALSGGVCIRASWRFAMLHGPKFLGKLAIAAPAIALVLTGFLPPRRPRH